MRKKKAKAKVSGFQNELRENILRKLFQGPITRFHLKQADILGAFAASLTEDGLADCSYSSVASRLDMDPSHLAYYFKTWEQMLLQCYEFAVLWGQEITHYRVGLASTPLEKVEAVVRSPFEHFELFPTHRAVLLAYFMDSCREAELRKKSAEVRELGKERLSALLAMLPRKPGAMSDGLLAASIQKMIVGCVVDWTTAEISDAIAGSDSAWALVSSLLCRERAV